MHVLYTRVITYRLTNTIIVALFKQKWIKIKINTDNHRHDRGITIIMSCSNKYSTRKL